MTIIGLIRVLQSSTAMVLGSGPDLPGLASTSTTWSSVPGKGHVQFGVVVRGLVEVRLHALGQVVPDAGGESATSASDFDLVGRAADEELAVLEDDVVKGDASSMCAAKLLTFSLILSAALMAAMPPTARTSLL